MKLNSTVTFTFGLLALMLGAGIASGLSGFAIGTEALKGITQPDSRPQKTRAKSANNAAAKDGMVLLSEAEIIKSAKARMANTTKGGGRTDSGTAAKSTTEKKPADKASVIAKLPVSSKVEDVTLEVVASRSEGDATLLDLVIKNESAKPIQFRYTFLTVTDDQGQLITTETIGLPTDIPPNGETFSGSVKLARNSAQDAKTVTLELSDYPEQKMLFRLADIPLQ